MKPRRIFLVGFMATGKTTVGRRLARRLGAHFVDLDDEICRRARRSIRDIFDSDGETEFRRLERGALRALRSDLPLVGATAGGAYATEENIDWIEANGVSVWLRCGLDRIRARAGGDPERPLLSGDEPLEALLARREPFYRRARITIPTDDAIPEELVNRILSALEEV